MRYGATDSLVRRMSWAPGRRPTRSRSTFELAGRSGATGRGGTATICCSTSGGHRRSTRATRSRGRLIAVDPGHPPGGARSGPTGLREAEANLAVALELRRLLEDGGREGPDDPHVRQRRRPLASCRSSPSRPTRTCWSRFTTTRCRTASIRSSTTAPASTTISRAACRSPGRSRSALVRRLGLRDLGIGRGDLALVRGTWMPSVLTEGLFMMLPDQEAALRSSRGQQLYAQAVVDGLRRYLRVSAARVASSRAACGAGAGCRGVS